MGDRGLTILPDGTRFADAITANPEAWLGQAYIDRRGPRIALLLKLLDAGQRLPVHVHPSGEFARTHLGHPDGKVEAWLVMHAEPGATVHLGFSRDVTEAELDAWVEGQMTDVLLSQMNEIPVRAGDVFLCPAGVPHAIGQGILVIELQEPTDLSIMLEWEGFPINAADRFLGLEKAVGLAAADRSGYAGDRLKELVGNTIVPLDAAASGTVQLLPVGAEQYFAAERIIAGIEECPMDRRFSVLFVTEGVGLLNGESFPSQTVRQGQTWLVPWSAGPTRLTGPVSAIRCYPT
jgi:mannose-6-phosphate isomerase